jgi:uncharacterized membrane protein
MLHAIDGNRVQEAIRQCELKTSGEIAVSVAPLFWGSVEKAARKAFVRMGMANTSLRNGVLIFVVPSRRQFSVLGDSGIHEKVGQQFWDAVARHLTEHFREGDFTGGLVQSIAEIGEQLAKHFPYEASSDRNELPNEVDFGEAR